MTKKELLESIYSAVENAEKEGSDSISTAKLKAFLALLIQRLQDSPNDLHESEIERYKAELASWVKGQEIQAQHSIAMFNSVITAGQSALRASFLINGGSAAALLAFIGQMWAMNQCMAQQLAYSMLFFMFGVLAVAFASGTTYLSQYAFAEKGDSWQRAGLIIQVISIICVLGSYALFCTGIYSAYTVLINT